MAEAITEICDKLGESQTYFNRLGNLAPKDLNDIMYFVNIFEPVFRKLKGFPGFETLIGSYKEDIEELKKNVSALHMLLKNFPRKMLKCMPCLKGSLIPKAKLEEVKAKFEKFKPIASALETAMGVGSAIADVAGSAKSAITGAAGKLFG